MDHSISVTQVVTVLVLSLSSLAQAESVEVADIQQEPLHGRLIVRPINEVKLATGQAQDEVPVYLSDLSLAESLTPLSEKIIKDIVMIPRLAIGEERVLTEEEMRDVIYTQFKPDFELKLPSRALIRAVEPNLTDARLRAEVTDKLKESCGGCDVQVKSLNSSWPPQKSTQTWRLNPFSRRPMGSFATSLEVNESGNWKSFPVSGVCTFMADAMILRRRINVGEKITPSDIELRKTDITYAPDAPAISTDLDGAVASRSLNAGDILWKAAFKPESLIRIGDLVKVAVVAEGVTVYLEGVSETTGTKGDSVRIKISGSRKIISGIITEKGHAEIK